MWGQVAMSTTGYSVSQNYVHLNLSTSLTLVDAAQGESALLLAENQDCSEEVKDCSEGTCSAASPAQIEKSSTSAIADQKIELSRPSTSLLIENSVSDVEIKAVDEGTCSAAPVTSAEKWSHEAIVARSNVRPERMQKLKVAGNSGQNPGFEYLLECWDDPAKANCDQEVASEVSAVGYRLCGWGAGEVG